MLKNCRNEVELGKFLAEEEPQPGSILQPNVFINVVLQIYIFLQLLFYYPSPTCSI